MFINPLALMQLTANSPTFTLEDPRSLGKKEFSQPHLVHCASAPVYIGTASQHLTSLKRDKMPSLMPTENLTMEENSLCSLCGCVLCVVALLARLKQGLSSVSPSNGNANQVRGHHLKYRWTVARSPEKQHISPSGSLKQMFQSWLYTEKRGLTFVIQQ